MKKLLIVMLLALALPFAARAQEDEAAAPEETPAAPVKAAEYARQSFGNFSLELPKHGTLKRPGDADWKEEEQVVFNWFGDKDDPIVLIQCRVDSFEDELEQSAYDIFCDTLLSNWLNSDDNYTVLDPPLPRSEGEPRRTRSMLGTHTWNLIQIDDHSDANGGKIYYSIFCTYSGRDIYTISFYYLNPMTKEDTRVKDFGKPLLESFRIAGEGSAVEEDEMAAEDGAA
ncbi:hypothetical protein KDL29_11655 [bacterium]|nr:hypothetical protein [bacterium]